MRYKTLVFLFLFITLSFLKAENKNLCNYESSRVPTAKGITDLALIYHGSQRRAEWNTYDLQPFVYRVSNNNKIEWQFDGFLFLEIFAEDEDVHYNFGCELPWAENPTKNIWDWLLNENFEKNRGVNAIESILDSLSIKGYYIPYKRQIVFSIPNAIFGQKNFGYINGKKMDFTKTEDRIAASIWYVDEIEKRWEASDFQYLNLEGFYWLHETIDFNNEDDLVIKAVQQELNSRGYNLTWIPYNWAEGTDENWRELGFDNAYQQPNYFFKRGDGTYPEYWVLTRAIEHAKKIGMYMELEFDENIQNPEVLERLYSYLDEYEIGGVWDNLPVAYYHGDNAFGLIARSDNEELKKIYKRLSDLLVKRQGKFSKIVD